MRKLRIMGAIVVALASLPVASVGPAAASDAAEGKLKPFGDFRLRHESDVSRDDRDDRHRERVRLRIGASYDLSDDFTVVGELRTGSPDSPKSPHQTLGNNFDSFAVSFDQAFVRWHPAGWQGFSATAGKFPQPFVVSSVYNEMVWDADLRPEGLSLGYSHKVGEKSSLSFTLARYIVLEQADTEDVGVWAGQAALKAATGDGVDWTLAADFHDIGDPQSGGTTKVVARNAGNLVVDTNADGAADAYASDFGLLRFSAAVRLSKLGLGGRPLTISGEMVRNTDAVNDDDTAFTVGASLGKTKVKGDWMLYWQYLKVEQESLFSAFAQDDFPRSTNFVGHVMGLRCLIHDKANLNFWALPSSNDVPEDSDWDWRLRADLNINL